MKKLARLCISEIEIMVPKEIISDCDMGLTLKFGMLLKKHWVLNCFLV